MAGELVNLQTAVAKLATDDAALIAKLAGAVPASDVQAQADAVNAIDASVVTALGS